MMEERLINFIKDYISQSTKKAITYEEYMNIALYHERYGYYMKSQQKIGSKGDFITSSNISNMFGMIFARVFLDASSQQHLPLIICEIGAGNGRFAKAILDEFQNRFPEVYEDVVYLIIESSPYHRKLQQEVLPIGEKVIQFDSLEQAKLAYPSFQGIIISNELFDAFPVRVIEKQDGHIFEVKVTVDENGMLTEMLTKLDDKEVLRYLDTQKITLSNQQRFEVPLSMIEYIKQLGDFVDKGLIYTIDYGYTNEEWMLPEHKKGSLRGYYQHKMIDNPLQHPGDMDLTTHISFDALIYYGQQVELAFVQKMRQDEFLLSAGILDYLQEHYDPNPFSEVSKQNRAIRSLIMGGGISQSFQVVIQSVGLNKHKKKR